MTRAYGEAGAARDERPRHGAPSCRRAADDRPRRVARGAGVRVRVRGSDRGGMAAASRRWRRGGRSTSRFRTSRAARSSPRCLADRRRPRRSRGRRHRRAAGRLGGATSRTGSRTSNATSSTTAPAGRARQLDPLPRGGRSARDARALAETVLDLVRDGTAPEQIAVVCPSLERSRASIETAFGSLGVPVAIEARPRLGATAFGQALLSLLRFSWSNGTRRDLFAFLRTPYGGLRRPDVDFLEGRLRGRAVLRGDRTVEETTKLRTGRPLPILELWPRRRGPSPAARAAVAGDAPQRLRPRLAAGDDALAQARSSRRRRGERRDRRAGTAGRGRCRRSDADDVLAALDRATVRGDGAGEPGRVAVLDLAPGPHAQLRGGLRDRSRAGIAAPPGADVAVLRRRDPPGARRRPGCEARASRCREPRPVPLLHRVHAAATAAHARAGGGDGRRLAAGGEPVLGGRVRALRPRRRAAAHDEATACAPDVADRVRADRAGAAPRARAPRRGRSARGGRARVCQRLAAEARPRAPRILATDGDPPSARHGACSRAARRSGSPISSGWRRARRPGSSSATSGPVRSTRSSARRCGARSPTSRCSASTASCRPPIPGAERVTPDNVEAAVELMHQCVDGALDSGLRIDVDDLQRRELGQGLRRDLEQLVRADAAASSTFVPRKLEVAFKAYELAPGVAVSGKIDRVDADPLSARGIIVDYKSGAAPSATQIHDEARLQIPLYLLVLRDQLGLEPMGGVYMPLGGGRRARGLLRARRGPGAGLRGRRLPRRRRRSRPRSSTRARPPSGWPSASAPATSSTTLTAASARPGATSGACAARSGREHEPGSKPRRQAEAGHRPNPQQQAAIEARGSTFVSAGAGTGKTTVLVERFARAVVDDGLDVDSLLVITYTDRAAGELRARIRARLLELERPDLARDLDGAWISTIHGFCRRLLTAYPLAAGIDPRFRVLDEAQARVLQGEAFNAALEEFCAADEPDRWQLLATYGAGGLRSMLVSVYDTLRSAGRELVLEPGVRESLDDADRRAASPRPSCARRGREGDRAAGGGGARGARPPRDDAPARAPARARRPRRRAARGRRRSTTREDAVRALALEELASRDRELLQELLTGFAAAYAAAKDRESALDFEDLQLRARKLLRENDGDQGGRAAPLPLDHGRRVPGHEPAPDGADRPALRRAAEGAVLRRRRVPVDLRVPPRRRRGVPRPARRGAAGAAADPQLPLPARGARGGQRAVRRRVRRRASSRSSRRPATATRCFGTPFELLVTDKASYADSGAPLAARRGAARRPAGSRARRRGRGDARRDRAAVRGRDGRGVVRGGAARSSTCRRSG